MYHAYMNVISAMCPGSAGDRTPPEFTVVPDLDTCNLEEQTIDHHSPALDVPEERIRRFVMKEVKIKLERGHSVSDIEEHLSNAAELTGGKQIPTSWPNVLKLMKLLGYTNPQHYKVCAARDHSFLLKSSKQHPSGTPTELESM